jgi:DNA-binding response OmpR family regulator
MPVLDGRGFIREVRARSRLAGIPIFVFSAHENAEDLATVLNVAGYLKKPLRMEDLLAVIQTVVSPAPPPD